jgi:hypothetical protein
VTGNTNAINYGDAFSLGTNTFSGSGEVAGATSTNTGNGSATLILHGSGASGQ